MYLTKSNLKKGFRIQHQQRSRQKEKKKERLRVERKPLSRTQMKKKGQKKM